jgi:hypothetical protein
LSHVRKTADPPLELVHQVFPWIEQEQAALEARSAANPNTRDFALKHFLTLLLWLRRVLLQDAAILSTTHSSLPIFAYAPFNTAAFHAFAAGSAAIVRQAAEDARLQLQNLPDQYAHTFRGLVTSSTLEQQRIFAAQSHQIVELTHTVEKMTSLLEMQSGSKKSRRRRKGKDGQFNLFLFLCSFLTHSDCLANFKATETTSELHSATSTPDPTFAPDFMLALDPAAFAPTSPMSTFSPSLAIYSPSDVPMTETDIPAISNVAPAPSVMMAPNLPLPKFKSMPPLLSPNPHITSLQHANWDNFVARYGEQRLRHHPMWAWEGQQFLPRYTFQPVNTICEILEEWSIGLNGFLSTRELEEGWGAKWRRNNSGLKTENGRRKKVVQLVNELSQKQGWTVVLALRFLRDRYEGSYKTPRKFCEFLQAKNNAGYHEAVAAADVYIA